MNKIKSLADQLRDRITAPEKIIPVPKSKEPLPVKLQLRKKMPDAVKSNLLQKILDYDSTSNKAMVHVKLDDDTAKLVAHLKMATGVDNIRLVAFAVKHLFDTNPELKKIIKQYTQNLEL